MKIITLLLSLVSMLSYGIEREYYVKYGIGITPEAKLNVGIKTAAFGLQTNISRNIIQQVEAGFYTDSRARGSTKGSPFAFYGLGIEAMTSTFFAQVVWSLGGILNPDAVLGGHFQFAHDFVLGIKGPTGGFIALDYKHISSAGIHQPNMGRDFIAVKTGVKLK